MRSSLRWRTIVRVHDRPSVLLVDPSDGSDLEPTLERCGFTVTCSRTPEAALFEFGQHAFDVVVAALPLPGMGAAGLCAEFGVRGRTPVLVVTAGRGGEWLDALRAGADDHIRMPCDERELRARLRALIRRFRGPLSPSRVVMVGELAVRLGRGIVTVDPALPLTPVQSTLLGHLAGHPGVALSEAALRERVCAVHGPRCDIQFDAELLGLAATVAVASGLPDAVEQLEGIGWRLATGVRTRPDA